MTGVLQRPTHFRSCLAKQIYELEGFIRRYDWIVTTRYGQNRHTAQIGQRFRNDRHDRSEKYCTSQSLRSKQEQAPGYVGAIRVTDR